MSRVLILSERAEADLLEIWLWTYEHFGPAQADRYLDELDAGMKRCCAQPESGKDRSTIRPGSRSRLTGEHTIFFTFSDTEVVIRRVLHAGMDFESHLPGL